MKNLLMLASASQCLVGLILLVYPPIFSRLLFGLELVGNGIWMSWFAGINLIVLAVVCWPDQNMFQAFSGMVTYSSLATLYFIYLGVNGMAGILLWPAVAAHAALSLLLVVAWQMEHRASAD